MALHHADEDAVVLQLANSLAEEHGGYWDGSHEKYPIADWRYAVANDDTRRGYWEWVAVMVLDNDVVGG